MSIPGGKTCRIGCWVQGLCVAIVLCGALAVGAGPALAAGSPVLQGESVFLGGAKGATIEAQIEPSGYQSTCGVQYVSESDFRASQWSAASTQPCAVALPAGSGVQSVQVHLSGLNEATEYRYRVLAFNQAGDMTGPIATFSTFGIESFSMRTLDEAGGAYTQAGGHPYELVTTIEFDTTHPENPPSQEYVPAVEDGVERDIEVELPAGLIGNPSAAPKCGYPEIEHKTCNPASQVGAIEIVEEGNIVRSAALYNGVSPTGVAARLGARINNVANATIEAGVRSGGDYGIDADSLDITGFGTVTGVTVRLWGVPAAAGHTPERACPYPIKAGSPAFGCAGESPAQPFLSMPTSCAGPATARLAADSYQAIGDFAQAVQEMPALSGCAQLSFAPEIETRPTTDLADSATGLHVDLHVPQARAPGQGYEPTEGLRTPDLRDAVVQFPAGMTVDPSSAAGLSGCSPAQVGLETAPDEQQQLAVEPRLDTSFTLGFEGHETAPIPAEATAATVQSALEGLPGIGSGNVSVSGGAGGGFTVQFTGALAGRNVALLTGAVTRPAVQRLSIVGPSEVVAPADSFNLAFDGHSTAATLVGTAHLMPENKQTHQLGYLETSTIAGALVTGEAITGPGIPARTGIKLTPGKIELVRLAPLPTPLESGGEYSGTFEVSLPGAAFPEIVQQALEAFPSIGYVRVSGGSTGQYTEPQIHSVYTIRFAPASGEATALSVTPAIEEEHAPLTISPTFSPAGTRALSVSVVQAGGAPHLNGEPAHCPDASKLGTVQVDTPLLEHPLPGALYLATPHDNPFGSLIAVYLTVYDPISGVVVKLPGRVEANPQTGQLTTTFDQNPQLPFEDLKVDLFSGQRAALTTPLTCGSYATTTDLTPWTSPEGADATPSSNPFQISEAPGGGACAGSEGEAPNTPGFTAGTVSPVAGSYSPFVLKLAREDGSQHFAALNVTLPPGLIGKIAGIEQCPQANIEAAQRRSNEGEGALEQSSPSCPAGSEVGTVHVGAGSGAPLYVTGHAYFAGPYAGAPFSLVIVTPAVAGPFDLGTVVVRAALFIDPTTAQVSVKSDPFPTILDGIPLDIRNIAVDISRPGFTLNPTSCETMNVTGQESSTAAQTANLSDRFQAGGCTSLPFHPSFTASTLGKASRQDGASLDVKVGSSSGQANIHSVHVSLPKALPSRQSTLKLACRETVFATNPASCPEGSDVGTATAITPLLSNPLTGPAYLVSHGGAAFPDLEIVLQGEGITLILDGKTNIDEHTNITSSTFESVPDAPISMFELTLPESPHSILGAPANKLCSEKLTMPTRIVGQNGALLEQDTKITVTGCAKPKTLTRTQKLNRALKACHKDKNRHKRATCEQQARKRYGSLKKKKK